MLIFRLFCIIWTRGQWRDQVSVSMRLCMRLNLDGTVPTGVTTFIVTGSQPLLGKLNEEVPRAFSHCKG
jgi:hypothetical protein